MSREYPEVTLARSGNLKGGDFQGLFRTSFVPRNLCRNSKICNKTTVRTSPSSKFRISESQENEKIERVQNPCSCRKKSESSFPSFVADVIVLSLPLPLKGGGGEDSLCVDDLHFPFYRFALTSKTWNSCSGNNLVREFHRLKTVKFAKEVKFRKSGRIRQAQIPAPRKEKRYGFPPLDFPLGERGEVRFSVLFLKTKTFAEACVFRGGRSVGEDLYAHFLAPTP